MTAVLLDGKKTAAELRMKIAQAVTTIDYPVSLAVILIGSDPASQIYVKNKQKACGEVGIQSKLYHLNNDISETALLELITTLNKDDGVHGILLQLPLPSALNATKIVEHISPTKDVDGFHPYNFGRLAQRAPILSPCTPLGIMYLMRAYQLPIEGQHAVIVGASTIVGRPMALELLAGGATITVCHSKTTELAQHIRSADIIVSATGKYNLIEVEWLNQHQVIIDVGIHRTPTGKIHGDIDFDEAFECVKAITPVPGGIGPMTIAMLLANTLKAAGIAIL